MGLQRSGNVESPQGSVIHRGDELLVQFKYSKKRFDAIKKFKSAVFNKGTRKWHLPLSALVELEASPHFDPAEIIYELDRSEIELKLQDLDERRTAAERRTAKNPFSVSDEDLKLINVDIVFKLKDDSLRAIPRYRSRIKRHLEQIPGVHYIKKERAFFMPTIELNAFIKFLLDKKYTFAVTQEAGKRLSRTAGLRAAVLRSLKPLSGSELRDSCLVPFIDVRYEQGSHYYVLLGWTTDQLRDCFPDLKSFAEKKKRAGSMTDLQLIELLYRVKQTATRIWLAAPVIRQLEQQKDSFRMEIERNPVGFPDNFLSLVNLDCAWITVGEKSGGLLVKNECYQKCLTGLDQKLLSSASQGAYTHSDETSFLEVRDSRLLQFYGAVNKQDWAAQKRIPASRSFLELVHDLEERENKLKRTKYYHSLQDISVNLDNKSLEKLLYPHQRVAVAWLLENRLGMLGDDMGLGKTLSVLAAFDELRTRGIVDFLLIVCPNSLVRNWLRECQQWTPHLNLKDFPGTKKKRQNCIRDLLISGAKGIDGLVLNYESLRLDYVYPGVQKICSGKNTFLCLDESQRVKNPQSKTFAALNEVTTACKRRVLLSGTPTPRDITDIWGQVMILDRGKRFGTNYYRWLSTVAELGNKWSEFAVKKFIPERVEETICRVHEILLRRKKEDVIDLPEKVFNFLDVELKGDQKKRYEEIRKELLLRVTSVEGDVFLREIDSILEEYLRAVQIASNPRLIDPNWKGEPAKFLELDQIVSEIVRDQDKKLVIWTNYRANVAELVDRYHELGAAPFTGEVKTDERFEIIEDFQSKDSGSLKILVAIPAAGGVGITLTAAKTAIYIDKTWNAEHWLQSIDRIHRIGQTGTVNIVSLNASKVDELIGYNLWRKHKAQEQLLRTAKLSERDLLPSREELLGAL
jgi:SNF2 family DNA or RNA helicase